MATAIVHKARILPRLQWVSLVRISCVAALVLLIYQESLRRLSHDWVNDSTASFGPLIPPVALYAAWLLRKRIQQTSLQEDGRGLAVVSLGCLLFLIGQIGADYFVTRLSLIVVLAGLTWTFWGLDRLRTLTLPFVLLATAVPLPSLLYNRIAIPLQLFASSMAATMIQEFGGTVHRDGNIIQLPGLSLGVAEACSGLSSLGSLFVAALLIGFLRLRRPVTKVALVAISIPLAIGVNVLRIAGTAVLATYREDLAMGFYHSFGGWLVFVSSFLMLFLLSSFLQWIFD